MPRLNFYLTNDEFSVDPEFDQCGLDEVFDFNLGVVIGDQIRQEFDAEKWDFIG